MGIANNHTQAGCNSMPRLLNKIATGCMNFIRCFGMDNSGSETNRHNLCAIALDTIPDNFL